MDPKRLRGRPKIGLEPRRIDDLHRATVMLGCAKDRSTKRLISAKFSIQESGITLDLPIRTKSEANSSEHWRVKHQRHLQQHRAVGLILSPIRDKIKLPCKIKLTRFAPNMLDKFDNLPSSFKYIVDAVCAIITRNHIPGRADSDERISIECDQVKSKEYGIRIEITNI